MAIGRGTTREDDRPPSDSTVRVLHLDDDELFLELTASKLERDEFDVLSFADPHAALDRLDDDVDCVVSDYQMPGMDGIEFLEAVREDHPKLPFLLFTGEGSEEIAGRAVSAGVTDYLRKRPGDDLFTLLANRIENTVAQYRAEQRAAATARRIREVHDRVSDAVVALDDAWRYTYVNSRAEELLGVEESALLGEEIWAAFPDIVDTEFETAFREAMRTQEPTSVEAHNEVVDTWYEARAYPDENGISIYFRDVTDRRERELREERASTESIFAAMPDPLYAFDAAGTFLRWNDEFEAVTGYDADEIEAMTPLDFVPEDEREKMADTIARVFSADESVTVESAFETKDGERVPYEFTGAQLRDEDGEVLGLVGVGRDVTERRERERELRRQNERLEEFASVLSHDLRNRLSVVSGSISLLDEENEHVQRAERALARMGQLIDDVLHLAEQGRVVETRHVLNAREVLEDALDVVALEDGVDVTLDCPPDRRLLADSRRFPELVENLLVNAVEHGDSVTVGLEGDTLYVADDGPGIPPGEREDVFDPGYSTTDGTGFGLAIVATIADAHGWTVSVEESDAGGARIEVSGIESPDDRR